MRGLRSFLAWWLGELAGMAPRGLLRALALAPPVLTLECAGERLVVAFRRGERGERSETVGFGATGPASLRDVVPRVLDGTPPENVFVELIIDQGRALRRGVRVPRAAAREIAGVVSFEIERHTPYRADEVIYDWSTDVAAGDGTELAVDLVMAPRKIVGQLVAAARDGGLAPDAIRVATGETSRADLPLEAAGIEAAGRGGLIRFLTASAVALGIVAAGMPVFLRHQAATALDVAVERQRARVATAGRRDAAASRRSATLRAIIAAKGAAPRVTRIVDRLSAILPDGTWLHHVSVLDGEVVIEGMTDRSTRLAELLEASPLFASVRYNAPVTRERGGRIERFSFALKLAGRGRS